MKRLRQTLDEPALIAYYCRACEQITKAESKGGRKKYSFRCPECEGDCLYGTARSLIHYFKIKESSENGKILLQMQLDKLKALEEKAQKKITTKES